MKRNCTRLILFVLLSLALILFPACNDDGAAAPEPEAPAEVGGVELLSSYPADVLPLYKPIEIESVRFVVRNADNYVFGKDIHDVSYNSSASMDEAHAFYLGLLTEVDEEYTTDTNVEGRIGEHPMFASFYENDDGTLHIGMTIGQKPADYVDANPYFADHPDLIEPFGRADLFELSYEVRESSRGSEAILIETYKTAADKEDFRAFYESKYGSAAEFLLDEDEYGLEFQWTDGDYTCRATLSTYDGPGDDFTSTIRSRLLP